MTDQGRWMYAVTDQGAGADHAWLTGVAGVAGGAVRAVRSASLTALVSDVDLGEFGTEALRRNLEDLGWLEEVAWTHHQVIDAAARHVSLLPIRLATVYRGDASVTGALQDRQDEFTRALVKVRGRVEWGVKAYVAAANPVPAPRRPSTRPADDDAAGGTGMAYLKRRRGELAANHDAQRDATAGARAVYAELAGHAADARLHPPQSPQLSGAKAPMLLNAAYLLCQSDGSSFASAVECAAKAHPELRLELTGPWPPYSFSGGTGDDPRA
jgi:hypothetical protein